jgi:hypothetical protein
MQIPGGVGPLVFVNRLQDVQEPVGGKSDPGLLRRGSAEDLRGGAAEN